MTPPATDTRPVHLSRLTLNTRHPAVHRDLRDTGRMHRTVQALFPDNLGPAPRAATGTLYRVETERTGATVIIQSAIPINRNALPAGYAETVEYRDLAPLLDWLARGALMRYRIDANPTKGINGTKPSRHRPLFGQEAVDWWASRSRAAGMDCALILDIPQPKLHSRPREKSMESRGITLSATRFEGVARITDPDAVRTAVTTGIGRGRAYGLGLLSLAPHRD